MSETEQRNFIEKINAMTETEKRLTLECFDSKLLWDELQKREQETREKLDTITRMLMN